jgi:hypothetical protein
MIWGLVCQGRELGWTSCNGLSSAVTPALRDQERCCLGLLNSEKTTSRPSKAGNQECEHKENRRQESEDGGVSGTVVGAYAIPRVSAIQVS